MYRSSIISQIKAPFFSHTTVHYPIHYKVPTRYRVWCPRFYEIAHKLLLFDKPNVSNCPGQEYFYENGNSKIFDSLIPQ